MSEIEISRIMTTKIPTTPTSDEVKKIMRHSRLGEFYAGWNAAIRAVSAVADAQGWWMPDSVNQLLAPEPDDD